MPGTNDETGFIIWSPFTGEAVVVLTVLLLVASLGVFFAGMRMNREVRLPMPPSWLKIVIVVVWALQILILLRVFKHIETVDPSAGVTGPVLPVTLLSAFGTFIFVAYQLRSGSKASALGSAVVAAMAGPMVFELPFVLIVGPVSSTPTDPGASLTVPFFIAMFTTLAMLAFCRMAAITRRSVYAFGGMLLVFAVWASLGFAYPSDPVLLVLNAVSKVLGFATVALLFLPRIDEGREKSGPGRI